MINAFQAVQSAQRPIAAVVVPTAIQAGMNAVLDASGSTASCGRTIASYAWSSTGVALTPSSTSKATITPPGSGSGTVTLTVTDSAGAVDTAIITVYSDSASSTAPGQAGATACLTALQPNPLAPTMAQAFSPATVGPTIVSTLTLTLSNANGFALTQSQLTDTLPAGLTSANSPSTTCAGANSSLSATSTAVTLSDANIPADGSCTVTWSVKAAATGTYTNTLAANALMTGPAGGNAAASSAALAVTTPNPPTVAEGFTPPGISQNASSTLTITLSNSNGYALTGVGLSHTLPAGVTPKTSPAVSGTCGGNLSATTGGVTLSGGTIPAAGSCSITLTVSSGTAGTYADTIAVGAVTSTVAGGNTTAASATLTVTASKSGGGALDWWDMMFAVGVLLATRRRRPRADAQIYPRR